VDLTLSLTHNCNLACSYCYAGTKRAVSMPIQVAEQALRYAFSFNSPRMQLGFFGGEPLLEWPLLQRCTLRAEEFSGAGRELQKTLTTNGTLLTKERAVWLKEHGFYVGISIDGNRAMHDCARRYAGGGSSFEACRTGLLAALEAGLDLEVIVVPDPSNVAELAAGVRHLLHELNAPRIAVNPNFYSAWDESAVRLLGREFESIADEFIACARAGRVPRINFIDNKIHTRLKNGFSCRDRCNFGEREIAVAPSGRIYPCERVIGDDLGGELCLGDVFSGIDAGIQSRILAQRGNVDPDCLECALRSRCMNWCCCINYALTGAINATDGIICCHEQAAIAAADRAAEVLYAEGCPAFLARYYGDQQKPSGTKLPVV
jgi:uncharacterized protein